MSHEGSISVSSKIGKWRQLIIKNTTNIPAGRRAYPKEYFDLLFVYFFCIRKVEMLQKLIYKLSIKIICLYTRLLLRQNVIWNASLPLGPKLIVSNHPSHLDPIYIASLFPYPINTLISEKAFLIPVIGAYLRRLGQVPVSSGKGMAAFDSALKLLEAGCSVVLFPEGRVSPQEGSLHPLRSGAARLALLTGVPVIPIGIYLDRKRSHSIASTVSKISAVVYWYLHGKYNITVGPAMYFEGDVEYRPNVLTALNRIMRRITQLRLESKRRAKESKQLLIDSVKTGS